MNELQRSCAIEAALVRRNPRGMRQLQAALTPGYYLRAASKLRDLDGAVLIGTGFPKASSFETDGPAGAIHLYRALAQLGARPVIACSDPLATVLAADFRVLRLAVRDTRQSLAQAQAELAKLRPAAVIAIECPGMAADGRFYDMRGRDISSECASFDHFMDSAPCVTIGVGDGGNEVGMGNVHDALRAVDIVPCMTGCDELLVADVSNWAVYGLLAWLGHWRGEDLLGRLETGAVMNYLVERGAVDGVTLEPTATEDGLPLSEGEAVIGELREIMS
jgi:hypothetical protein